MKTGKSRLGALRAMNEFSLSRRVLNAHRLRAQLALAAVLLACAVAAHAQVDLTGVWRLQSSFQHSIKTSDGQTPPLLPEAAETYRKNLAKYAAGDLSFDKSQTLCTSPGMPRLVMLPAPFEIVQERERLAFIFQWNHRFRIVDLSGTPPVIDDLSYRGTASGQWEGNVLVVHIRGLVDTSLLDMSGMPHSEDLQITERYRLENGGKTLVNELSFDDPKTFTHPWKTIITYRKLPRGTELEEDVCRERIGKGLPAFELAKQK